MAFYWKRAFKEAGLGPERPLETQEDCLEYVKKLQKVDRNRTVRLGDWAPSE